MASTTCRAPERDLCADLRNARDPDLGDDTNVCTASNRQLRLYVAGWMLSNGTKEGDEHGLRKAVELYQGCGRDLLDKPGHLTTATIAAELMALVASAEAA